jgi:hypothetical protein
MPAKKSPFRVPVLAGYPTSSTTRFLDQAQNWLSMSVPDNQFLSFRSPRSAIEADRFCKVCSTENQEKQSKNAIIKVMAMGCAIRLRGRIFLSSRCRALGRPRESRSTRRFNPLSSQGSHATDISKQGHRDTSL